MDTVIAAVQTVVSVVYDATVATLHFFENLPQALATWGEQAVARTVSGLKSVGNGLDTALKDVFTAVGTEVSSLFSVALSPIQNAYHAFALGIQVAILTESGNFTASGNVTKAAAVGFYSGLSGPVFPAGSALATGVLVALVVVSVLSLGAGFLISVLVNLVFSAAMKALEPASPPALRTLEVATTPSGKAVYAVDSLVSNTTSAARTNQTDWKAVADDYSWVATLFSVNLAWQMMFGAFITKAPVLTSLASFILGVVGFALAIAAHVWGLDLAVTIAALVLAGMGLGLDFFAIRQDLADPPLRNLDLIGAGLDISTFLIALGEA